MRNNERETIAFQNKAEVKLKFCNMYEKVAGERNLALVLVAISNINMNHYRFKLNLQTVPEAATFVISLFRTCAIKPSVEKMTKPAKTLVPQLIIEIIIASLNK